MQILFSRADVRSGLAEFRSGLQSLCGDSTIASWAFPGGGKDDIPTWTAEDVNDVPLSIGVGANGSWGNRTPILIARSSTERTITPCVEINIPNGGDVNRRIGGCLCRTTEEELVIAHRGTGLTTSGNRVTREQMQAHFAKWLVDAKDSDQVSPVIPAAPLDDTLIEHLARFADEVIKLKAARLGEGEGDANNSTGTHWRERIQFPEVVAGFAGRHVEARDYRHGPIQAALLNTLRPLLRTGTRAVFNQAVDLAIVDRKDEATAIFEVKTGLGSQLYSGVGQLMLYRARFGSTATRLFLVLPESAIEGAASELGLTLGDIGIDMIVFSRGLFTRWDQRPLRLVLGSRIMRE